MNFLSQAKKGRGYQNMSELSLYRIIQDQDIVKK